MRRLSPARIPETLAFLMRRRALGRIGVAGVISTIGATCATGATGAIGTIGSIGTIGTLAFNPSLQAGQLSKTPIKVVSVGSALTEIVYALGAQSCLVGVDTTSTHPKEALRLPQVGYARSLSAEGILALAPDVLITTEEAGPASVLRQISAAGVTVKVMPSAYRYQGLVERVSSIGCLLSREAQALTLIDRLNHEWAQLHSSSIESSSVSSGMTAAMPRVLFLFGHSASRMIAAGLDTGAHAMIEYAGAINATNGFTGYKPLTPEAVVLARPDVLLLTDHGVRALGDLSTVLKLPGIGRTPAGRNQRIETMEASLLLGFGPRMPQAVRQLRKQLIGVERS